MVIPEATSHWRDITIHGFRGLERVALKGMGSFNLLVGANDVGKSSVLEAVWLLSGSANLTLWINTQKFRRLDVPSIRHLKYLFHDCKTDESIRIAGTTALTEWSLDVSLAAEEAMVSGGSGSTPPSASSVVPRGHILQSKVQITDMASRERTVYSGRLVKTGDGYSANPSSTAVAPHIIPARFLHAAYAYDPVAVSEIIVSKRKNELLKYLRTLNQRIDDVTVSRDTVYLDIGFRQMLPINVFGAGVVRTTSILAACLLENQSVILVDEIENGIHYRALEPLLRALLQVSYKGGVQICATTHRLEVLRVLRDILKDEQLVACRENVVCHALQRDKHGAVSAYRYDYSAFDHCIGHGLEIR